MQELAEGGSRRAQAVIRITDNPPRFIAAMQLGVTATSLAIGALGEPALRAAFEGSVGGIAALVRMFFLVFRPLVWVLQRSTELALGLVGLQPPGAEGAAHSEAELKMLLTESTEHGEIEHGEREMLYKVFDFADKEATDVMVPRPEVVALSIDLPAG